MKHPNGASVIEVESQLTSDLILWGLEKYFFSAVTDRDSNMNAFGERILRWNEATFLRQHYCADHILQLTVVKTYSGDVSERISCLDEEDEEEDTSVFVLKKACDLVTLFHSATVATERLIAVQKHLEPTSILLKLLQDVKTRWWSTYSLVKRVLELREALLHLFQDEF
jgi:hypothetical protein